MCPLILDKRKRRPQTPAEAFDLNWVEEVAIRCRIAQNCLTPAKTIAPQDWQALGVLVSNDIPEILNKVTQLLRGREALAFSMTESYS